METTKDRISIESAKLQKYLDEYVPERGELMVMPKQDHEPMVSYREYKALRRDYFLFMAIVTAVFFALACVSGYRNHELKRENDELKGTNAILSNAVQHDNAPCVPVE